jgi:hypothetical protein
MPAIETVASLFKEEVQDELLAFTCTKSLAFEDE